MLLPTPHAIAPVVVVVTRQEVVDHQEGEDKVLAATDVVVLLSGRKKEANVEVLLPLWHRLRQSHPIVACPPTLIQGVRLQSHKLKLVRPQLRHLRKR